jgi:hypothetical protein
MKTQAKTPRYQESIVQEYEVVFSGKRRDSVTGRVAQLEITCNRPIHSNVIPNPSVCGYDARTACVLITSRNEVGSPLLA